MESNSENPGYRSAKSASRQAAAELAAMLPLPDSAKLEAVSQYNPDRHEPAPRLIETKPERFAIEAHLIAQVAELALVGDSNESRLPALQKLRGRDHPGLRPDQKLEALADDWFDAKYDDEIGQVLDDPKEAANLARYEEIILDVMTDPHDIGPVFFDDESGRREAAFRIDPAASIDLAHGGYFLIKWSGQLLDEAGINQTDEERRAFLHDNIAFLDQIAQLEFNHSDKYFRDRWGENLVVTAHEAGVHLMPGLDGKPELRLAQKEKPPPITLGPTVGCPAGFDINPAGSAIHRLAVAYINEAYERGLLTPADHA